MPTGSGRSGATRFMVGDWEVDSRRLLVRRSTDERRLDPRVMGLLVELAAARGEVVRREELMARVWRDAFVSENTIVQAVSRLRRALDDSPQAPVYVETISKTGYRLKAPVRFPGSAGDGRRGRHATWRRVAVAAAVLVVLTGSVLLLRPPPAGRWAPLAARPLLTNPGRQPDPALSPDGTAIAFVWQAPDRAGWDLYVQPVDGDRPTRLSAESGTWQFPAWADDGRLAVIGDDGGCAIYVTAVSHTALSPAAHCPAGSTGLAWAPDARRFVVSAPAGRGRELIVIDAATGVARPLLSDACDPGSSVADVSPAFSGDGTLVAFARVERPSRHLVMVAESDGSACRALTDDAWGQVRGVNWGIDDASVIYSTNRSGAYRLWRVGVDGSAPVRLPIEDEWLVSPSVARHARRLVYRTFNDEIDLWMQPLGEDGTPDGAPARVAASTRSEHEPALSPEGTRIAFVSDRTGATELWSAGLDGSDLVRHTAFDGPRPTMPAWSPDGRYLVFGADPDGRPGLFRVAVDGREPVRLTDSPHADANPAYSRDGQRIYFASDRSGDWQLWSMAAGGGDLTQLTVDGAFFGQEDPTGRFLYFVRLEEPGLWRMPATGGAPESVVTVYDSSDWASWAVTARELFFSRHAVVDGYPRPTIERYDLSTRARSIVARPDKQMPYLSRSLTVSADGRLLIFSRIERSDDEVVLVELR